MTDHDFGQAPRWNPDSPSPPWGVSLAKPASFPAPDTTVPPPRNATPPAFTIPAVEPPPYWHGPPQTAPQAQYPPPDTPARPSRAIRPALIVAVVLALLVSAGGVYVAVAGLPWTSPPGHSAELGDRKLPENGPAPTAGQVENGSIDPSRVGPVQPATVTATCQAPPSVDSVGNTITYEPELTLDAVAGTAWRCPGSAVGHRLVYGFGQPIILASVGLIPGYAKVDPADGTDRFEENRTVTAVTWHFDDGTTVSQTIASPSPTLVTLDLPAGVTTSQVILEIAATGNDGAIRDFTAVSDVRFTGY